MKTIKDTFNKSNNVINTVYFRCSTCKKMLMVLGSHYNDDMLNDICSCDNPVVDPNFFIFEKKEDDIKIIDFKPIELK